VSGIGRLSMFEGVRVGRLDLEQIPAPGLEVDPDAAAAPLEDARLNPFEVRLSGADTIYPSGLCLVTLRRPLSFGQILDILWTYSELLLLARTVGGGVHHEMHHR
jgi:hypothetical protein